MISLLSTVLLCSLDSLIFAAGIGLLRGPGLKKRNLALAFAIFDFAGSIAGLLRFPSARFVHPLAASQLLFLVYLALLLLVMFSNAVGAQRVYVVAALLSLDNFMQPVIDVRTALASGVMSGLLAFVGLWLGELVGRQLYVHASGPLEQNLRYSQVTQIPNRLLTVRNRQ